MAMNHDKQWLARLHEAFVEALRCDDFEAIKSSYLEDAVLLPPRRNLITGQDAIAAFWKDSEWILDLAFETTDTVAMSDTSLREAGMLLLTISARGQEETYKTAKYLATWANTPSGWKIDAMTWNAVDRRTAL